MPNRRVTQAIERSIDLAVGEIGDEDVVGIPFIPWLARAQEAVPPWWSFARDEFLRDFWKRSSHLSLMMYTAQNLLVNTPMRVEAKDTSITSHVDQAALIHEILLKASEFGETLFAAKKRFAEDYLSQDNGGFLEIIGNGPPDGAIVGLPLAVRHLDSRYCWRTRSPDYPVVYHDPLDGGKAYKLHRTRVIAMSQMTSTNVLMNGVGYCAVSRSMQFAQHLYDIYVYKQEKLGSRPISQLLVGAGFKGSHIMQAVKTANEMMSNANLTRYSKIVGIGSENEGATLTPVPLNDFDPFEEDTSVNLAMYGMAAAWGIPIQEVWPASSGRKGRAGDFQESRQRGKMPAEFNAELSLLLSHQYLPPHLKLVFDWRDDYQDERRAVNQDIRARNRERDIKNEAVSLRVARETMVDVGDLTRDQFVRMELAEGRLEDGSPVTVLFYREDDPYSEFLDLGLENPTDYKEHDKEEVFELVSTNRALVEAELAITTSARARQKLWECLAALNWLEVEYEEKGKSDIMNPIEIMAAMQDNGTISPNGEEDNTEGEPADSGQAGEEEEKPGTRNAPETQEGSVEDQPRQGKALKQNESYDKMRADAEAEIQAEFDKEEPDRNTLVKIVAAWLLFAYLEGAQIAESDLTSADRKAIKEQEDLFLSSVDNMLDRKASGNDMEATTSRLVNQIAGLYWLGFVKGGDQSEKLIWVLGFTKQHCADCGDFDGQVKTKAEWAAGGKLPQSGLLECTGVNCQCMLVPA
jgi:hypothetical protein